MTRERRLLASVTVLTLIAGISVLGYVHIEDASAADALYMTVITISTVGFTEVIPLSEAGRLFTVGVIVFGVGAGLYTAVTAVEMGIERFIGGELRRKRMARDIDKVSNHVILCGFGRVGANTWRALTDEGIGCVVIEADADTVDAGIEQGALIVVGDATKYETLEEAGAARARAVIACVRNDNDNLVIVLSSKNRWPDLPVISRATELEAQEKLRLAGADRVVSPQLVGALRMASLAANPRLDEFVDLILHGRLAEYVIEGIEIQAGSPLHGKALRESGIRDSSGALVVAVESQDGGLSFNPEPDLMLQAGQMILAMGSHHQVETLRESMA